MFIKKTKGTIAVNYVKLLGIIILSIFFSTNSYSKTLKTEIVAENEYGGIYAIKLPLFSAKRKWQPTFDKINDLAEKNCNIYSKNSYLFVVPGFNNLTIQPNGKLKVKAMKQSKGYIPDYSYTTEMSSDTFRFFCGKNLDDALDSHALRNKIFSQELYSNSSIGDSAAKYVTNKNYNKRYEVKDVPSELKNKKRETVEVDQTKFAETGWAEQNVGVADFEDALIQAKKTCKDLGFKQDSEKFSDCVLELIEISDAYAAAKVQENMLIAKAKEKENINMKFSYETESGKKINKESIWKKFFQSVAWVLYEHGEDILNLALDLKYGTNYSGYNTSNQTSLGKTTRCTGQVIGNVGHVHCPNQYCSVIKSGKISHVICRPKN